MHFRASFTVRRLSHHFCNRKLRNGKVYEKRKLQVDVSLQSTKMLSNSIVFEKNIQLLTGLTGARSSGQLLGPLKVVLSFTYPSSLWECHQFHGIGPRQMLVVKLSSHVSTPQPSRTRCDIFCPRPVPAPGCPGPDRRGCGPRTSGAPRLPHGPGAHRGSRSPAGAHSLEKGAGTWAADVLCPERKRVGTPGPPLSP